MQIIDLKGNRIREKRKDGKDTDSTQTENDEDDANVVTETPASFFSFYSICRGFFRFAMNQFFRDITVLGTHNVPKKGPVIFCGNHNNQFCDGTLLFS
jgi:hypothetical protein